MTRSFILFLAAAFLAAVLPLTVSAKNVTVKDVEKRREACRDAVEDLQSVTEKMYYLTDKFKGRISDAKSDATKKKKKTFKIDKGVSKTWVKNMKMIEKKIKIARKKCNALNKVLKKPIYYQKK
jgi:hypothetical protein